MAALIQDVLSRNFVDLTDEYRIFAEEKDGCRACPIYSHYTQVVQSEGACSNPIVMFCGEAPGRDETIHVRPFIGRAGQLLRNELRKYPSIFNKRTTIISNILACRPMDNQFPTDDMLVSGCFNRWLRREILMLKPSIIVMLGAKALHGLCADRKHQGITQCRGQWFDMGDYDAKGFATYHPSYVLRCVNDMKKQNILREFESDIHEIVGVIR